MTSIPASRSARAMIFAPRSCPSRPGLAITTLVLDCIRAPLAADGGRGTRRAPGRPAKRRTSAAAPRAGLLELGLELVADAEARLDERVARRDPVDLLAQAADEDVDGAVAVGLAPPPDLLQQLVPGDDAPAVEGEGVQELELRRRQAGVRAADEGLHLARVDPQLLDLDRLAAALLGGGHPAPRRRTDGRDELAHRERLDEVVVGSDLERMDTVVLGPARGDDDDRRTDPLRARGLDQLPAVELGQHEIEDADVRILEAQPGEPDLAAPDDDRVEAGRREVARHPVGDHRVVLDDQDLGHAPTIVPCTGCNR